LGMDHFGPPAESHSEGAIPPWRFARSTHGVSMANPNDDPFEAVKLSFTAFPATIPLGGSCTLHWEARNDEVEAGRPARRAQRGPRGRLYIVLRWQRPGLVALALAGCALKPSQAPGRPLPPEFVDSGAPGQSRGGAAI